MRIKIAFESTGGPLTLPLHYNHIVQGFVYHNLGQALAAEVHNSGYKFEARSFRMFVFSRLLGRFRRNGSLGSLGNPGNLGSLGSHGNQEAKILGYQETKIPGNQDTTKPGYPDISMLTFTGPVTLWLASPLTRILESFVSHLARAGHAMLGNNEVRVTAIEVPFENGGNLGNLGSHGSLRSPGNPDTMSPENLDTRKPRYRDTRILVRTLSPITVYSTLTTGDGRKKTYYYSPFEPEFSAQIGANLAKKRIALGDQYPGILVSGYPGSPAPETTATTRITKTTMTTETTGITRSTDFAIRPVRVGTRDQHVVFYRDTVVKAWSGSYELSGDPELIRLAFDCGIGAKNSQGFGMIERCQSFSPGAARG